MPDDALIAILEEHLRPLGPWTVRRMFGGRGLFADGLMFGLIASGTLYFKVDEQTQPDFESEGQDPFTYDRKGERAQLLSYWQAPERLLDEPEEIREWAARAIGAARRAAAKKSPRKKRSQTK